MPDDETAFICTCNDLPGSYMMLRLDSGQERENNMTFNKTRNGDQLIYTLSGRLDTAAAPQLEEDIRSSVESANDLVLDITDIEYISSAGLRVLLSAQKTMNQKGGMVVKGANSSIKEIFDITGFSNLLHIE